MPSTDYSRLDRQAAALGCPVVENAPLAPRTTFKIGGPADRLITVESEEQLAALLALLAEERLPWMVLGRGSNLLVGDRGYRGAALALEGAFQSATLMKDGATVKLGAGMNLAAACVFARDNGLSGLEFAWGIPGTVGGALYMNAGAYGGEVKDVAVRARHMGPGGVPGEFAGEALGFAYRRSAYTGGDKVITFGEFRLRPGDREAIAAKMEELMARRKEKQPYDRPSAGSAFKRPKEGFAAALIEQCGLKGRSVGGAQVSVKHAGFIINTGGATCKDVLALMDLVREEVFRQTGVQLEPEVRVAGEV